MKNEVDEELICTLNDQEIVECIMNLWWTLLFSNLLWLLHPKLIFWRSNSLNSRWSLISWAEIRNETLCRRWSLHRSSIVIFIFIVSTTPSSRIIGVCAREQTRFYGCYCKRVNTSGYRKLTFPGCADRTDFWQCLANQCDISLMKWTIGSKGLEERLKLTRNDGWKKPSIMSRRSSRTSHLLYR